MGSVLFWQKDAGAGAVSLRDDPDLRARAEPVSRQNPPAVLEAEFVLAAVVLVHVSPVSIDVAYEVLEWSLTRCLQRSERTGCGYDPTGLEFLGSHGYFPAFLPERLGTSQQGRQLRRVDPKSSGDHVCHRSG